MKHLSRLLTLLVASIAVTGCGWLSSHHPDTTNEVKQNSMYYWKTTFKVDSCELAFLEQHNIKRLYVRMFDVATEQDFLNGTTEVVPIATTKFVSATPTGVEIVPVTYITIDALRAMDEREEEFAPLIVERLLAMASYNKCGEIGEVQLDCDWTANTRESFHRLCRLVKTELAAKNIELSVTVRLHQMDETPPPADRAVLMLYNTGALKNPHTYNSILYVGDVRPYLHKTKYAIPLDYAYPTYGWGVKFSNNKFVAIVSSEESAVVDNEHIRYERPSVDEILEVKDLVERCFGKPASGNILYHLDSKQLENYEHNEIDKILAY
jgi:hypothetical protein